MTLNDIVNMNKKLVPKPSNVITIGIIILTIICTNFMRITVSWIGILAALLMSIIFMTIIPMNYIYNKSVFGEYAYQYMCLPVSYSDLVKGKVLAAFIYCTISVFIFTLCAAFFMISIFNSGGTAYGDFIEKSTIALINTHKMLSNNTLSTESVIFIIGTANITVLIESLFISVGVFYAVIIRNIIEPEREKVAVAISVIFAAIIIYIAFSFLCVWIPGIFFENDLAIAQMIIAGVMKISVAYGMMIHSAKLLEKKYSLN